MTGVTPREIPSWPEGLKTTGFSLQLLEGEFAYANFREAVVANGSGAERENTLVVLLGGNEALAGWLGTARIEDNARGWMLRLSLFQEEAGDDSVTRSPHAMDLAAFPTLLAQHLSSDPASELGHLTASYFFEASRWQTTLALPLPMPGVLEESLGTPQLTGVEFQFDRNATPMRHLELSLSPERDLIFLRLRIVFALYPTETFFQRHVDTLAQFQSKFVEHITPAPEIVNNA